jgi:hypothetical protein
VSVDGQEPSSESALTIDGALDEDEFISDQIEEVLDASEDIFVNEADDIDYDEDEGKKRKKTKSTTKVKWTENEEEEIRKLFKRFFDNKRKPRPADCLKAIDKSKRSSGFICKRAKNVLKKKVFRMIEKLV